jgi:hypothetical protein
MPRTKLKPCHCGNDELVERPFIDREKPNIMVICSHCDSHMTITSWMNRREVTSESKTESAKVDVIVDTVYKLTKDTWNKRVTLKDSVEQMRSYIADFIGAGKSGIHITEKQFLKMILNLGGIMVLLSKELVELQKTNKPEDTDETVYIAMPKSEFGASAKKEDWN